MQKYQRFVFDSYSLDQKSGEIALKYSLDDTVHFTEHLKLPPATKQVDPSVLDRALFALHMIGGVSYYKTCVPKTIEIRSGSLTKDQAHFFHEVYEKGLGEFFFRNDIDFRGLIQFPSNAEKIVPTNQKLKTKNSRRVLVPIGGGKDSIVTAELLKKAGYDVTLLRMTGHPIIDEMVEALSLPCLTIERKLDPQLFELNKQGALNGHVPITAYLTFAAHIVAMLQDFDAVVLSNERSANIGNVSFKGMVINHQWSKSME
ncbi:MAG TPA: endonuclease domain-containing protein, partial [Candidatus Nanoarchaeia archaeon]|nr:endonuclease domain-containing protein [Candidatus Nanoarchaeia archaeon]